MIRFKTRSGSEYWVDYPRWGRTTRSGGLDLLDANEGYLDALPEIQIGHRVEMLDTLQGLFTTTPVTAVLVDAPPSALAVKLAAALRDEHGGPRPWPGSRTSEEFAAALAARVEA